MKPITLITMGVGLLLATTAAKAAHSGPVVEMSLNSQGGVVIGWDNTFAYMNEDPPFGVTFDIFDIGTLSPGFRFLPGTPTHLAYSFVLTTPLYYWNHTDADPQWGATPNGEYIEINGDNGLVAVVTDGVSPDSPAALAVPPDYEASRKSLPIDELEDHTHSFFIYTPDGQGGGNTGGSTGAYGLGMQVHLWQEDAGGALVTDHGLSDPFFLGFRIRPTQGALPVDWMPPAAFAQAVAEGQALVPEPSTAAVVTLTTLFLAGGCGSPRARSRRHG